MRSPGRGLISAARKRLPGAPRSSPLRVKMADESDSLPRDRVTPTPSGRAFLTQQPPSVPVWSKLPTAKRSWRHIRAFRSPGVRLPVAFERLFPSRQASPPFAGRLTATRVFLKSHLSPRVGPGADAAPTARPDAGCRASASRRKLPLHGRRFVNPFRLLPCCNHARRICDFIRN